MRLCPRCGKPSGAYPPPSSCQFCGYVLETIEGHLAFAPELAHQSEGFEASYFDRLSRLEPGNFWFEARNQLLIWALQRYFPAASCFLEIGCGTGFVLAGIAKALPHLGLSGSEVFTAGLSIAARRTPRAELFQMDARQIPFVDHFDVIGAFDVLEHIREDDQVLAQMRQALRIPGGGIMITVPQHPFLWSKSDEYAHHVRRYRIGELEAKVERAGFKVVRATSFVSLLLPLMLAARLKQRRSGRFDPSAEFEISALANKVLSSVMSFERTILKAGLSFPAGGSLLLLAKSV